MTDLVAASPSLLSLLSAAPDGVLAVDRDLRITFANPAAERLAGAPAAALAGRTVADALPWLDGAEAALARALGGEPTGASEAEITGSRGHVYVEARYAPVRDDAGEVCGAMAVLREVAAGGRTDDRARTAEVLEAVGDGFSAFDRQWRYTYVNAPVERMIGRPRGEIVGRPISEILPRSDTTSIFAAMKRTMDERVPTTEVEFYPRYGLWLEARSYPTSEGIAVYTRDVSDARRAEAALRHSEERYRSLVVATTQMVWTTDARGMVLDMPFWRELTGQDEEQVRGEGWSAAIHPDDRERVLRTWWAAFEARSVYECEYRLRLRDGTWRWFAARGVPVTEADGSIREWVGVFDDVHERRSAEAALRESEQRYRLAMLATRDVVWDWDLATDEVRFGESIRQVLGYDPGEVDPEANWWYEHIHPDDRDRVVAGIHRAIHDRVSVWTDAYRHLRADGTWAEVEDRAYLLYGDDGRPVRMVGATQDVTERRRAEAARESERVRLRRVLAQMPAAVSVHEGPDHVFVALSDAMRRLIGPREVIGVGARAAIPELAAQGFADPLDHVYRTGETVSGSAVTATWDADGDGVAEEHVVDYAYEPLLDGDGRIYGVVSVVADVTERERAARELAAARHEAEARADEAARLARALEEKAAALELRVEESRRLAADLRAANEGLRDASARAEEARHRIALLAEASGRLSASLDYRATVQTLADLAVATLADWCFVEVRDDDGSIRLLACGHRDPEMVALAFDTLRRYPIDPDGAFGTAWVLRTGQPELVEQIPAEAMDLIARSDEHREVLRRVGFRSNVSVPLAVGGRTFGVLSLVQGESGRRFTEADLPFAVELGHRAAVAIENARLYEEALAANRAKAGFLATMSHELRTPLNAMIGYVDLLLLGIPEQIPAAARGQVERIRLASRHLLSIIEEILTFSRLEAGRETVETAEVDLAAVTREVSAIIEPLAAEKGLRLDLPVDPEPATLMTDPRKLRQILVNLLGNAVKFTPRGTVGFEVERADGAVLLHVRDTGIGIDAENHEIIFEAFRQVDDTKTRVVPGTGLGLTVSRELARLLGGDITVRSAPGQGSVFTVQLPLS
jgi:PAS domain S-box-containing protein